MSPVCLAGLLQGTVGPALGWLGGELEPLRAQTEPRTVREHICPSWPRPTCESHPFALLSQPKLLRSGKVAAGDAFQLAFSRVSPCPLLLAPQRLMGSAVSRAGRALRGLHQLENPRLLLPGLRAAPPSRQHWSWLCTVLSTEGVGLRLGDLVALSPWAAVAVLLPHSGTRPGVQGVCSCPSSSTQPPQGEGWDVGSHPASAPGHPLHPPPAECQQSTSSSSPPSQGLGVSEGRGVEQKGAAGGAGRQQPLLP